MVQLACFQDTDLLETYKGIAEVFDNLSHDIPAGTPEFLKKLFSEVEQLQNDKVVGSDSSCRNLCVDVSQTILEKSQAGTPLSPDEKEDLLRACDELRLRCLATSLGVKLPGVVGKGQDGRKSVDERIAELESQCGGTINYGPSGVTSAVLSELLVILLPPMTNAPQLASVIDHVHDLFGKRQEINDIAIDFSAVKTIPILLMANMVAYRQALSKSGRKLHLGWIREGAMTDPFKSRMVKVFKLNQAGGFLFSDS